MQWVDESGRHQGYVAAVPADGGEPRPLPDGNEWWRYNGADGPRAVAVRGACECGWRGTQEHPVDFGDDEKTEAYEARTGPFADWEYHVTQAEGLVPYDVEQMIAALQRRVAELSERQPLTALRAVARIETLARDSGLHAVGMARAGLVSWAAVGQSLGISRQAAHERFSRHVKD